MEQAIATPLDKVISALGSASELARSLGITPQAVLQWTQIPANRVLEIEKITGITRHELRPDVFGAAPTRLPRRRQSQGVSA